MAERRVGVRELKAKLSECMREVRSGGTIVVTERGRPVARMIADASSPRQRVEALTNAGGRSVEWPATETHEACCTGAQRPEDGSGPDQ